MVIIFQFKDRSEHIQNYFLDFTEMLISLKISLFSLSVLLGSIFLSSLEMIKKFIKSKPPGRRLVIPNPTKIILIAKAIFPKNFFR